MATGKGKQRDCDGTCMHYWDGHTWREAASGCMPSTTSCHCKPSDQLEDGPKGTQMWMILPCEGSHKGRKQPKKVKIRFKKAHFQLDLDPVD